MWPGARSFRLGSGLVLFTYLTLHLFNHALGLISLGTAETGLRFAMALWHSAAGSIALYGAAIVHVALALRTIYERRHWRVPAIEVVRLYAGFSLPLLLVGHAMGTRLALTLFGTTPSYERVVDSLIASGSQGWQIALLAPGWVHGCLGLWLSLRRVPALLRLRGAFLAIMLGMPLLSAAGFETMERDVKAQGFHAASSDALTLDRRETLSEWQMRFTMAYLAAILAAYVAGQIRNFWQGRAQD